MCRTEVNLGLMRDIRALHRREQVDVWCGVSSGNSTRGAPSPTARRRANQEEWGAMRETSAIPAAAAWRVSTVKAKS